MNYLISLYCRWKGHRRGKLLRTEGNVRVFGCPRCKATWTRKVKA